MGSLQITTTGANTWNWPAGVTTVIVELLGGGGAGGGATGNPALGGGGRGGGYSKKTITKGAEASLTINVGTGGIGGTTANGASAAVSSVVQGGTTVATATAGASAIANVTTTLGGAATTDIGTAAGDTTFLGGSGAAGTGATSSGGGGGAAGPTSAGGAASGLTGGSRGTGNWQDGTATRGGAGGTGAAASVGTAGFLYGGAGSGGAASTNTDRAGGNGAQGIALLTWVDPPPALDQSSFGFYADGTELGSTPAAAQDSNIALDLTSGDASLGLRVRLQEGGGIPGLTTDDYQLRVSRNGGSFLIVRPMFSQLVLSGSGNQYGFATANNGVGQTIIGAGQTITGALARIAKANAAGSYTANVFANIYAISGTFGSGSEVPTGSPLAVSDAFNPATLTTSLADVNFTFSGANQIVLTAGTAYAITFEFSGATVANDLLVIESNNVSTVGKVHAGSQVFRNNVTWSNQASSNNLVFSITPGPEAVIPFDSASLTDGNPTTNRLSAGTGSFVAGKISEDGEVNDVQITASNYTELLFTVKFVKAGLNNSDVLDFKVYRNGAAIGSYSLVPEASISKTAPIFTRRIVAMQAVNRAAYW
jgi:hypothetical protein